MKEKEFLCLRSFHFISIHLNIYECLKTQGNSCWLIKIRSDITNIFHKYRNSCSEVVIFLKFSQNSQKGTCVEFLRMATYNNNLFHENKPSAPTGIRKDNMNLSVLELLQLPVNICACSNKSNFPIALLYHVICIDESNLCDQV